MAGKRSSSKRADNKSGGTLTRPQKRKVKELLAVIRKDAKHIDLGVRQVVAILDPGDFKDS